MIRKYFLALLLFVSVFVGCKDTNSAENENDTNKTTATADSIALQKATTVTVYAWVDKLRMRDEPDTKSDVVAEISEGAALTYLDEKTDFTQQITLRGKAFDEPWLKVSTSSGKEGWVYGGGVKFYQPKVAALKNPYDGCMDYFKRRRIKQAGNCFAAVSKKQLSKDRQFVKETGEGALEFMLLNGKKKQLDDSSIEEVEARQHYFYRYYVPQMGLFVVDVEGNETDSYLLVNDKSGNITPVWGFPVIAPDYKKLLSIRGDLLVEPSRNGIQIFAYTNEGLELVFEEKLDQYEPIIAKWLDIEEAEITLLPKSASGNLKLKIAKLQKNGSGEWILDLG